ncbi:MAG: PIN domain-containing protein [Dehalococcoidia bacterium]|nr:PIN domain-containing protein [Dehalococcoidia bacterium]
MKSVERSAQRRAFLDSAGFLALVNPHDRYHQEARGLWAGLTNKRWRTFTTNFVVAETHALFLARLGQVSATAFLREMEQSSTTVIRVSPRNEERARWIIYRYDDRDFSFTDATSFAMMEQLNIPYAFTFDRHFAQYGLTPLTPDRL